MIWLIWVSYLQWWVFSVRGHRCRNGPAWLLLSRLQSVCRWWERKHPTRHISQPWGLDHEIIAKDSRSPNIVAQWCANCHASPRALEESLWQVSLYRSQRQAWFECSESVRRALHRHLFLWRYGSRRPLLLVESQPQEAQRLGKYALECVNPRISSLICK